MEDPRNEEIGKEEESGKSIVFLWTSYSLKECFPLALASRIKLINLLLLHPQV